MSGQIHIETCYYERMIHIPMTFITHFLQLNDSLQFPFIYYCCLLNISFCSHKVKTMLDLWPFPDSNTSTISLAFFMCRQDFICNCAWLINAQGIYVLFMKMSLLGWVKMRLVKIWSFLKKDQIILGQDYLVLLTSLSLSHVNSFTVIMK